MNKRLFTLLAFSILFIVACTSDSENIQNTDVTVLTTFNFTHDWDGALVTNSDFNNFQFTNQNGETISIERLRYLISDITFTNTDGETIELDTHNLVDLTNGNGLNFSPETKISTGNYTNVSFTFGFDNEDNSENYIDLNSASFNVPDMLGGGYHYMQFDGKYLSSTNNEEGNFNYHAIRAADNPGPNPTFPQDTFFTVDLGPINITSDTNIEIKMNIAEWFKNPNQWDLNVLNTVLMPNSAAQIMMFQNGQSVFSLGTVSQ
ncbi:hypothetical protein J1C55_01845 [Winogradskyella sp. E313]|uniref:Copper-binding protein MbnP-like domain-containing protein n=1 Tax=Winogradskyella immobilis TaxID=2816852 RepID=A0ABS8EL73_9FLAO|nr:hypothetical protein [Winogradskyella immobilis]